MLNILGCKLEGFPQTYLGLPLSSTKLHLSAFTPQIAKTDKYLAGWQASLLTPMGRAVLVNSVLDSHLIYIMSAISLPLGVVAQIDRRRRSFLWTGEDKASGACCLVAWEKVCTPKVVGGLGIKDLRLHNRCLLVKLIHRFHSAPNSSWAAWARANCNVATLEGDVHGMHWNNLRAVLPIYQAITTSVVGNGHNTNFWHDAWCGEDDLATRLPALYSHCLAKQSSVHDIVTNGLSLVPRLSDQAQMELHQVQDIINDSALSQQQDTRVCSFVSQSGKFQTSKLYDFLKKQDRVTNPAAAFIWSNKAPPRAQFFAWLLTQGKIQSKENLLLKKIVDEDTCDVCGQERETADHIVLRCHFAKTFWLAIGFHIPNDMTVQNLHQIERPSNLPQNEFSSFVILCCWQLWKRRNGFVFRQEAATLNQTLQLICAEAASWSHRHSSKESGVKEAWNMVFSNARL
ncbi:TUB-transcription factor 14 [Zea mays]|uniref:TUB-transcription factor 14 n=1 Tax=Zea mays TaxID=4577 RepID=A0A1D6ITW7_MAIZE|nr:TUB-transcription factor 14 [Zea mays]AQK39485.1 TUB-transcription factor 14 [Zea mays]